MPIQIYWKFYHQKLKKIQIKNSDIFHTSAKNIDCGCSLEPPLWGGSNEYPQSMFLSRNKKNNVYPCKPQFYYIKVGFKGVKIIKACFCDVKSDHISNKGQILLTQPINAKHARKNIFPRKQVLTFHA